MRIHLEHSRRNQHKQSDINKYFIDLGDLAISLWRGASCSFHIIVDIQPHESSNDGTETLPLSNTILKERPCSDSQGQPASDLDTYRACSWLLLLR